MDWRGRCSFIFAFCFGTWFLENNLSLSRLAFKLCQVRNGLQSKADSAPPPRWLHSENPPNALHYDEVSPLWLLGAWTIPTPVSSTHCSVCLFTVVLSSASESLPTNVLTTWGGLCRFPELYAALSSLIWFPVNSSHPDLPKSSSLTSTQRDHWACMSSPSLWWGQEILCPDSKLGQSWGSPHLRDQCLALPSIQWLETTVSHILYEFCYCLRL